MRSIDELVKAYINEYVDQMDLEDHLDMEQLAEKIDVDVEDKQVEQAVETYFSNNSVEDLIGDDYLAETVTESRLFDRAVERAVSDGLNDYKVQVKRLEARLNKFEKNRFDFKKWFGQLKVRVAKRFMDQGKKMLEPKEKNQREG